MSSGKLDVCSNLHCAEFVQSNSMYIEHMHLTMLLPEEVKYQSDMCVRHSLPLIIYHVMVDVHIPHDIRQVTRKSFSSTAKLGWC